MNIVPIKKESNSDAIAMLEDAIERVKSGEITACAISWVTESNSIGGDISCGDNQILMWASIAHSANSFYNGNVDS